MGRNNLNMRNNYRITQQSIGVKSENHECSIALAEKLLGETKLKSILSHKEKRIDAQYYLKFVDEVKLKMNLEECRIFVLEYKELIRELDEVKVKQYQLVLSELIKPKKPKE